MLMVANAGNRSAWLDFGIQVAAGFVVGAILLFLGYLVIDRRLHLKERHDRAEREETDRGRIREHVLTHVLDELMSNAAALPIWKKALSANDLGVPYPGFDVAGWSLISQAPALLSLEKTTISSLAHAYYRLQSANEMLKEVADICYGSSSLLARIFTAPWIENPRVEETYRKFQAQRDQMRSELVARLDNLKPRIDDAIDAVERELDIPAVPAAQRQFVSD
jgi:hypothetical protein